MVTDVFVDRQIATRWLISCKLREKYFQSLLVVEPPLRLVYAHSLPFFFLGAPQQQWPRTSPRSS